MRAADAAHLLGIDLARQMEIGVAGIEPGDVRVAQVVPADIVDRAARRLAELGLVERRLDQVLGRGVARHAVIDDEVGRPTQRLASRSGQVSPSPAPMS